MATITMLGFTMLSIYFVFLLIKPINFSKFMPYTPQQAALLKVVIATILGYLLASCFISMTNWVLAIPSSLLKH